MIAALVFLLAGVSVMLVALWMLAPWSAVFVFGAVLVAVGILIDETPPPSGRR